MENHVLTRRSFEEGEGGLAGQIRSVRVAKRPASIIAGAMPLRNPFFDLTAIRLSSERPAA